MRERAADDAVDRAGADVGETGNFLHRRRVNTLLGRDAISRLDGRLSVPLFADGYSPPRRRWLGIRVQVPSPPAWSRVWRRAKTEWQSESNMIDFPDGPTCLQLETE